MNKPKQSGRSMIEMLAVLAIVGVLSISALAVYVNSHLLKDVS